MAYSKFTLKKLKEQFQLETDEKQNLFAEIKAIQVSDFLAELLRENISLAVAIGTEKARSEFIIAPILAELRKICNHEISLFSGVKFNVDRKLGLNGICDFIICKSSTQIELSAPVIMLVEAKREDIFRGIPQCVAEMYAAKIFNEHENNNSTEVHGIVTSGTEWKFLKLEKETVFIDRQEYHSKEIGKILAILLSIVGKN